MIVLGNKHSGKRSLVDSLFDISKTTIHNKKLSVNADANKMKLRGLAPIIDYAYLNVLDLTDPDYRKSFDIQELIANWKSTWYRTNMTLMFFPNSKNHKFWRKLLWSSCSISLTLGLSWKNLMDGSILSMNSRKEQVSASFILKKWLIMVKFFLCS